MNLLFAIILTLTAPTSIPASQPTWFSKEIGPQPAGATTIDADKITTTDFAKSLAEKQQTDSFRFVYQPLKGNFVFIARLRVHSDEWKIKRRAGLMFRQTLDEGAPYVMLSRQGDEFTSLQTRQKNGEPSEQLAKTNRRISGASWMKLERTGATLIASESMDGSKWTVIGQPNLTTDPNKDAYVGLACASVAGPGENKTFFDNISLNFTVEAPATPAGVVKADGTFVECEFVNADAGQFTFTHDKKEFTFPLAQIVRVYFTALRPDQFAKIETAAPGILTAGNDFLEGEYKGIDGGAIKINSILFGLKRVNLADTSALVLQKPK